MVSIKDIARAAHVSHSTVSRALRDSPLVNPETARAHPENRRRAGLYRQRGRPQPRHAPHQYHRRRGHQHRRSVRRRSGRRHRGVCPRAAVLRHSRHLPCRPRARDARRTLASGAPRRRHPRHGLARRRPLPSGACRNESPDCADQQPVSRRVRLLTSASTTRPARGDHDPPYRARSPPDRLHRRPLRPSFRHRALRRLPAEPAGRRHPVRRRRW